MTDSPEETPLSRRDVLKSAGAAGAGFALTRLGLTDSTPTRAPDRRRRSGADGPSR
jgi:hypothetical protein